MGQTKVNLSAVLQAAFELGEARKSGDTELIAKHSETLELCRILILAGAGVDLNL